MIKRVLAVLVAAILLVPAAMAQKSLPKVKVQNAKGESVTLGSLIPEGKAAVISFWDTACKPCIQELGAISDVYDDWAEEFDFEVIAVSIDDARSSSKVFPFAKGRGWPFVVCLDKNGDLRRAMNIHATPTTFVVDKNGKIVWTHVGYAPGGEKDVHDILANL